MAISVSRAMTLYDEGREYARESMRRFMDGEEEETLLREADGKYAPDSSERFWFGRGVRACLRDEFGIGAHAPDVTNTEGTQDHGR